MTPLALMLESPGPGTKFHSAVVERTSKNGCFRTGLILEFLYLLFFKFVGVIAKVLTLEYILEQPPF
jgi:hypothetical protein